MRRRASSSSRETWAWEIPSSSATSSCVRSRKKRSRRIRRCRRRGHARPWRSAHARASRPRAARSSVPQSSSPSEMGASAVQRSRCVVGTRRAGDADGSRPVAQMPAKLTLDGAADVCGQQLGATGIAPVDRTDDRERRDLRQVVALDTTSCKAPRGAARQRQVLLDQAAPLRAARNVMGAMRDDATRQRDNWKIRFCIFRIGRRPAGYMSSWIMRRTSSFGLSLSVCGAVAALAVGPARADDGVTIPADPTAIVAAVAAAVPSMPEPQGPTAPQLPDPRRNHR